MKRVLFIGHEATRTGAPMVLMHFLRWLKANDPEIHVDLLLLLGGELEAEYRSVANVFVVPEPSILRLVIRKLNKKLRFGQVSIPPRLPRLRVSYDLVIGNTVATMEYLELFKRKSAKTICWLHELKYIITSFFPGNRFVELSGSVDHFIVPCGAVQVMLSAFGIEKESHLVYEFSVSSADGAYDICAVKESLGIPESAFVVGGGGTIEWRKAADLFLQIAAKTVLQHTDIYFIWVGGKPTDPEYERLQYDFERLNLNNRVIITGVTNEPLKFFAAIDIFALTSREDPFPLVCLEAASLSKPVICFENSGGMPEFVENDAGAIVPYGDVDAFCEKISFFRSDKDALERAGKMAAVKIRSKFSSETSCRQIDGILRNAIR